MSRTPPQIISTTAIADTGASSHYLRPNDPHDKNGTTKPPITVGLPNGDLLQSTTQACQLSLPQLPDKAREAHIIPGLTHSSLVSIGKLCDEGCEATFNKKEVHIIKDNEIILTGQRDLHTGLWRIPLTDATTNNIPKAPASLQCHNAYQTNKIPELIQFLHATAFSPVPTTWIRAIQRGFFQSWPGLTTSA